MPLLGAIMRWITVYLQTHMLTSMTLWMYMHFHTNTHTHTHTHTHQLVLRLSICTSQTLIDPHYFNMKITTTWNFSHGSNIQRLATALYGSLSLHFCVLFLPYLNCRSGTSSFANHNTVGTAFALPSPQCTQTLFHVFLLFFLIICLFWLFFSFPNGNFEVDWCCLFRANSSKHKG